MGRNLWLIAAGLFGVCLITGCTFQGGNTTHHIGYVQTIDAKGSTDGVSSKAIRTIGVRFRDGIGVGYFDEKRVVVPLDCRLVIIVRNQAQLDEALQRLEGLKGRELCVAIES